MKLKILFASAIMTLSLGCSKDAATRSNFKDALNHYYARLYTCTNYTEQSFPRTLPANVKDSGLDALANVGLLTKSPAPPTPQGTPQAVYTLTDKGRSSAFSAENPIRRGPPPLFCFGDVRVDKIVRFTEPAPEDGVQVSRVEYTVRLTNVPSWAEDRAVQNAFPNMTPEAFQRQQPRDEVLGLTDQGWRVAQDR